MPMLKSYTKLDYCFPTDFNADATDAEIMQIADLAAESEFKIDNNIIEEIYNYACSFEHIGSETNGADIYLN